eukprot:Protomagalhaensia_sp_Gyna_25__4871@NODE_50_length_6124_cov_50_591454_g37_i0_p5_GENE_NODE_50_length_6124_cov_50_591454_g37_i0NODE_50_length_6124_cov_50_591454_g37_i0_p5_ORF_typecomplete_len234_score21_68XTBD/PF11952_8/1_4e09Cloacin/PF03515_14/2_3_NODE_50_length_6124_cov_50_591454_g37_i014242125
MKTLISPAQWESLCQFQERLAFLEWYAEREGLGSGSQAAGLSVEDKHRLVSMAQCFANVRFLKTEYADEIMQTVEAFYQTRPSARPAPPAEQPHFHIVRQHERGGRRSYNDRPSKDRGWSADNGGYDHQNNRGQYMPDRSQRHVSYPSNRESNWRHEQRPSDQYQYQQNRNNVERRFPRPREESRHFNQGAPWQQQPPWQQQEAPPPPSYNPPSTQQRQAKQPCDLSRRGVYQ